MATLPTHEIPPTEFVSVREYLTTSYRPDCEYIDGRIEERNLGEYDHGLMQTFLAQLFMNNQQPFPCSRSFRLARRNAKGTDHHPPAADRD